MAKEDKAERTQQDKLRDAALAGAANEVVQRYGSAAKEHFVAYTGVDNEAGKRLTKGLKDIAAYATSEEYYDANIKQQAGFSAEVKTTARRNAERIISREPTRTSRTDDLGRVNDQLYDLVDLDANGNAISGTGSQMKFVGSSPDELLGKLSGSKFSKYLDADAALGIADDDYDALMGVGGQPGIIDGKISKLEEQVKSLQARGKAATAEEKIEQIEKYKKIKNSLRKTGMTREEAIEARLHPRWSTAKDVGKIAHRAGVEQAKMGAAIAGSVSLVRNFVSFAKGEKTAEEAAADVVVDTASGAAVSYATAFSGSVIKGAFQNSSNSTLQAISKTNLPARLATTTLNVGRTMGSFLNGDIDGTECIEKLGQDGFAEIGSAMFATAGASLTGNAIVGALVGSTIGYAAAAAVYQELATSLKEAKLAREERIRIEKECQEAIELIEQYRNEMNAQVSQYLTDYIGTFSEGFIAMDQAICENDINGFIKGNTQIQRLLGHEIQFETQEEFDDFMLSDVAFKL